MLPKYSTKVASIGMVVLSAVGPANAQSPILHSFGFTAIACEIDDPHDATTKTDYSDEVAAFTNLNQVCLLEDPAAFTAKLVRVSQLYDPLIAVEPLFFTFSETAGALLPERNLLWPIYRDAILASGLDPTRIVFYLIDEPTLRNLPLAEVATAAQEIRTDFPNSRLMMVEAFDDTRPVSIIPEIDLWGFDHYFLRDPGADPAFMTQLNDAAAKLAPRQKLALIMDANYTDVHEYFGLKPEDMGDVAKNYLTLAQSRTDIAALLGYTWVSIDGLHEFGARNMPPEVVETYRQIGQIITRPK